MSAKMLAEINEIPVKALEFLQQSPTYSLPLGVPYLGMGSSYFAPLSFKYMGVDIQPEMASEFFNYLQPGDKLENGVILSQSGRSSEALWCTDLFQKYVAITNYPENTLSTNPNVDQMIDLLAGDEQYSSSKTYINTLIALFKGFDMDCQKAVDVLVKNMPKYEQLGKQMANEVFDLISSKKIHGIYIVGSGPNIPTAYQSALIMCESTKLCFNGMTMAQYDHGPKETAADSIVIQIIAKGKSYERSQKLTEIIVTSGAHVITVEEPEVDEHFSIINNMLPFNYMAYYLAEKQNITETFVVGGKVTEVN
jgi:glucosamine--fructose-6-phosphate aminotransferase (isomerizing)